ncbi:LOW QUALITY PROTEIN: zinc finger MYM-type protein 1-like [Halichoeres trimaculatus]|uniref:LOW QUALITY PROTEIN: zinc finger MYM-type protein 1-like n=1 Tax=Halichoeres trimaculatus TaxID=147232 RepID=UPI003D9F5926
MFGNGRALKRHRSTGTSQSNYKPHILDRREYLKRIAAVTAFLGKQGIAFRGHNESLESSNKGNFIECMQLLEKFDPFLQKYKPASCATYLSPSSQNEMIQSTSELIISRIISEIKEAEMFAIMVDEARDHRSEQLALCVRYVSPQGIVKERFLGFSQLDSFDARSIADTIEQQLEKHGLGHLKCVAQFYDGAAVMSRAVSGVQTRFREKHPEALYIHCHAHELNLVLCASCKAIPEARDLFNLLECLYSFFSTSPLHHHKLQEFQRQLGLDIRELVQLSTTRWACRVESVKATLQNLPALIQAFGSISAPVAKGLESKLCQFSTIYMLVMFDTLLSVTQGLHKYLQKETIDLVQAMEYKTAVQNTVKSYRCDEKADEIFDKTKTLCDDLEIHSTETKRKKRKNMDDFIVETFCGAILTGLQACQPASEHFLEAEALKHLAEHYSIPLKPEEIVVAKNYLEKKKANSPLRVCFPFWTRICSPLYRPSFKVLTIPVTSCSCERSFSALRRLHTWLRNTMGQERLSNLAIMSIEKEVLQAHVDHEEVIDRFAKLQPRRFSLTLPPSKH